MESELRFGDWVKRQRKMLDLTQKELAQRVGCSTVLITKIENDERRPSRQVAQLLADNLEVPAGEQESFLKAARSGWHSFAVPSSIQALHSRVEHPAPPKSHLPIPVTPLVGRGFELVEVLRLLNDPQCRLLTMIGPGGIGKTRLALQAATMIVKEANAHFPDGVFFVSLASLIDESFLVSAIGSTLGFKPFGTDDPHRGLLHFLENRSVLLVLDSIEHLLAGSPDGSKIESLRLITELMQRAPAVKLLVTSTVRLGLSGEWSFELSSLPVPDLKDDLLTPQDAQTKFSSVGLFLQSARRLNPSFVISEENLPDVVRICQLMRGIPLGIELAAAWIRLLTPNEIWKEIERNLDFLMASERDVPERHRSLRAVFDHSYRLLSPGEQHLLARLSVFPTGFTRQAAEHVAGASLVDLSSLVDKSLLYRSNPTQYEIHGLIRQYAAEQLTGDGEQQHATRMRHSRYFLGLMKEQEAALKSARQKEVLAELGSVIDDLRAAWDWALSHGLAEDIRAALRAMQWFYDLRGWLREGVDVFGQACERFDCMVKERGEFAEDNAILAAHLLAEQGWFRLRIGQYQQAKEIFSDVLTTLHAQKPSLALVDALAFAGTAHYLTGEYEKAFIYLQDSLEIGKQFSDPWITAYALGAFGRTMQMSGDYARAKEIYLNALETWQSIGDIRGTTYALSFLGNTHYALGEYKEAEALLLRCLRLEEESGDLFSLGTTFNHLALLARAQGDYIRAEEVFQRSIACFEEIGENGSLGWVLNNLAHSNLKAGELEKAEVNFAKAIHYGWEAQMISLVLETLSGFGYLAYRKGELDRAVRLLDLAYQHPAGTKATRDLAANFLEEMRAAFSDESLSSLRDSMPVKTLAQTAREYLSPEIYLF